MKSKKKRTQSTFAIFKKIFQRLEPKRRRQFWVLLTGMIVVAFFESAAIASIAFFASIATNTDRLSSNRIILFLENLFNVDVSFSPAVMISAFSVVIAVLILFKNASLAIVRYWSSRYAVTVRGFFGFGLLQGFLQMPYIWHTDENSAQLIKIIGWRIYIAQLIKEIMLSLSDGILIMALLTVLILSNPSVSIVVLVIIGSFAFLIYRLIRSRIDVTSREVRQYTTRAFVDSSTVLQGLKDVQILGVGNKFLTRYRHVINRLIRLISRRNILSASPPLVLESVGFCLIAAITLIMFWIMHSDITDVLTILALLAVTSWRVLPAVNRLIKGIASMRTSIPFVVEVLDYWEIINKFTESSSRKETRHPFDSFTHNMKVENLSYKYPGSSSHALKNVSFTIGKGQSIGIIGHSGAGKSTLIDLITGLLEPTSGRILIDDRDINEIDLDSWRKLLGYVPQNPYVLKSSLAENVAFGERVDDIDRDRVIEVCSDAAIDFLTSLEQGIDTNIGERGIKLSGGQAQRVAIARSLYKRPEILIFDEATSSLDQKTESAIQLTIDKMMKNMTVIIISHRLSTVRKCKQIVWLENGEVVRIGSPRDIIPEYNAYQLPTAKQDSVDTG